MTIIGGSTTGATGATGAGVSDPLILNDLYVGTIHGPTGVTGNAINVTDTLSIQQIETKTNTSSGPTGASQTIDYDFEDGDVFAISQPSDNWTANITNLPVVGNKTYGLVFMIEQGNSAFFIDAFQIASSNTTILWSDATAPTATANRTEVESFTLFCSASSNWTVLGQYASFG